MNSDPASLDNLRDIVQLPPVSWWPLAPGWWVVLMVLAIISIVAAVRAWQRWSANAYRRAALHELQSATTVSAVEKILKRAALCAFSRKEVASLAGHAWCQWLGETSGSEVPPTVAHSLTEDVFRYPNSVDTAETRAFAAEWIKHHQSPDDRQETC